MSPPKLLHIATSHLFWGFLEGQARYARRRGFEVHAASSPGPGLDAFAVREGATAWSVPLSRAMMPRQDFVALLRLWRLMRRLRPAVVHAHTAKAGLLGMTAALLARVPVRVYTLHGLVWRTRRGWRRRLLVGLDRLACRCATSVLAVSPSVRRAAVEAGLAPPGRIVVPGPAGSANGVDGRRFRPQRGASRNGGAAVLGFVGRLVPDKGVAALVEAWEVLRDCFPSLHLLVIGAAEPHDPLPAGLLARLRADDRVEWTGWVEDTPQYYRRMDLLLVPSLREGLPYAVLEAAAMEVPAVGFDVDGVADAIEHNRTGLLVASRSPQALAAAVAQLLDDPERRRALGREARRRVLRLYRRRPLWAAIHEHYHTPAARDPAWKRPLDAAGALALLLLLSPLLALTAAAVRIGLGRPVVFRQERPGRFERPFGLLKFRTMREAPGLPDGLRLTRLGRWLRRTSLDELPQLLNILRGDMSFIGPRPLLARYLPFYTARERLRHRVRPGLTGWAQVNGRNDAGWRDRLEMDAWYVEHLSFGLDLRIALRTVGWWLTGRGFREDPGAVLPDLDQERQRA
jgi:lipopolysaccharide/colanic/teichoic acid biosynthesis glycosyltransferase